MNANALLMRFASGGALRWRLVMGTDLDGGSTVKLLRDECDNACGLGIGPTPAGVVTRIHMVSPTGQLLWMWYDFAGIGSPVNMKCGANGNLVVAACGVTGFLGGVAQTGIPAEAGIDGTADAAGRTIVASLDPATQQGRLAKYGDAPRAAVDALRSRQHGARGGCARRRHRCRRHALGRRLRSRLPQVRR